VGEFFPMTQYAEMWQFFRRHSITPG
jgi:hypothetical protein